MAVIIIRIICKTEEINILLLTLNYRSLYGSDINATFVKPEPDSNPIISRNTSLAIVAPGIAEALFATALGLLAAIPSVVAFNKFNNDSKKYSQKLENFSKRFLSII